MEAPAAVQRASVRWWLVAAGWIGGLALASGYAIWIRSTGDWSAGLQWERDLLGRFPRRLPSVIDFGMLVLPWLGTNFTLMPASLLGAAWLNWKCRRRDLALHLATVQIGTLLLHQTVKALFDRPRPELWERRGQFAQASYPSGHMVTIIGTMFTVAVMLHRERGWRWPYAVATFLLVLSAYSRLYLGVHWPTDIAGGVLAGVAWFAATMLAFRDRRPNGSGAR